MKTRCASSRVAVPNPKHAWLILLESAERPMLLGAAYEPGPGTCGLRLARSALGCRNLDAVPNENLGGLPFLDEFCGPNPLFMSYTAPGPSLPKSARQWSTEMKTRASALRSALPNPKTGAEALRESCCTPSIERPDALGGRDVGRRTSGMVGREGGLRRDPPVTTRTRCGAKFRRDARHGEPLRLGFRLVASREPARAKSTPDDETLARRGRFRARVEVRPHESE
jgi:hypothetical protein